MGEQNHDFRHAGRGRRMDDGRAGENDHRCEEDQRRRSRSVHPGEKSKSGARKVGVRSEKTTSACRCAVDGSRSGSERHWKTSVVGHSSFTRERYHRASTVEWIVMAGCALSRIDTTPHRLRSVHHSPPRQSTPESYFPHRDDCPIRPASRALLVQKLCLLAIPSMFRKMP
jgi:hypothetical protein